jgi:hypothetical protein
MTAEVSPACDSTFPFFGAPAIEMESGAEVSGTQLEDELRRGAEDG